MDQPTCDEFKTQIWNSKLRFHPLDSKKINIRGSGNKKQDEEVGKKLVRKEKRQIYAVKKNILILQ